MPSLIRIEGEVGKAKARSSADETRSTDDSTAFTESAILAFTAAALLTSDTHGSKLSLLEPARGGFTIHCLDPLGYIRPS